MSETSDCTSNQSSETCSDEVCEKSCLKCFTPEELTCLHGDAVVEIRSEFILLGAGALASNSTANGDTPLSGNSRADVFVSGSGFFIKGHYIIAPAHLVLLPPSLTSVANRYPLLNQDQTLGQIKNQIVRASRILVTVFNVNGCGFSFIYEAKLVGVDGAGDIAILRIKSSKPWNIRNPCIEKHHPFLTFGSSREALDGEKVYVLGHNVIVKGLLCDHRFTGTSLAENILVSATINGSGFPIINCHGHVIGLKTFNQIVQFPHKTVVFFGTQDIPTLTGLIGGPSEFFIRRIVKIIIQGLCSHKHRCHLEKINDPAGSYLRYKKAYAGIAYEVFNGADYDITVDYTSGLEPLGQPRVRLSPEGEFLDSPISKQIIGLRVLGLAGANPNDEFGIHNGYFYVPGGLANAPLVAELPDSPFLGKLQPGDIITHIEGVALGDLKCQITPSLITWRLCECDKVEVCYRRGGNALNTADNSATENYDDLFTVEVRLIDFPYLMDYPWYAIDAFPKLSSVAYPGFIFPGNQSVDPQTPSLRSIVGAAFHDAF